MAIVAARQTSSPTFGRRSFLRRYRGGAPTVLASVLTSFLAIGLGAVFAAGFGVASITPAAAQGFTYNPPHTRPKPPPAANPTMMRMARVGYFDGSSCAKAGVFAARINATVPR